MMYFVGFYSDIFSACGVLLGGIIVCILSLLIIAFIIIIVTVCFVLITSIAQSIWYWFCYGMTKILPEKSQIFDWFNRQYLDMKYPSRKRRRKRKSRVKIT